MFAFCQAVTYAMYAGAFYFGAYLIEIGDMEPVDVYRQVIWMWKLKYFCKIGGEPGHVMTFCGTATIVTLNYQQVFFFNFDTRIEGG